VTLRLESATGAGQYKVDSNVLKQYWTQCLHLADDLQLPHPTDFARMLELPGVVSEVNTGGPDENAEWPVLQSVLKEALQKLQEFRTAEGESMHRDLRQICRLVAGEVDRVAQLAPSVVVNYRNRLQQRVNELLRESDVHVQPSDLIREVSIYSERADINEELTRLRTHFQQFEAFLDESVSQGRKLEFLCQEMFREVNTVGAKANDVGIAHGVVEMKAAIEKMREILQNVE
jgi:uncharacterized protein (TIGR00255 family)